MLPPISGYTDYPYRNILTKFNPPFIITEMISAQAVICKNPKTMQMLKKTAGTHYNGIQLFGSDPKIMGNAAKIMENMDFDYIDINMGCTIKKVASTGAGISLMKQEEKACLIANSIINAVSIPVTCKLRLGTTKQNMTVISLSKKLMDTGATAIIIHGRTGEKKLGESINFNLIKKVVDNIPIPIVANGGIFTGKDAEIMIKKTGAAAVMPGRGIVGNPWLISELKSIFSNKPFSPPTLNDKKNICLDHLQQLCEYYGVSNGVIKMRKILPEYFSNCHNLKNLKLKVQHISTCSEIFDLLENISPFNNHIIYKNI